MYDGLRKHKQLHQHNLAAKNSIQSCHQQLEFHPNFTQKTETHASRRALYRAALGRDSRDANKKGTGQEWGVSKSAS